MRLLNALTLELKSFHEHQVPQYAVLSHTWGPDEDEVTFQDMLNGSASKKLGFQKIVDCCREAQS